MADIDIDVNLNAYLGLPDDYQIDKREAFKLFQYLHSLIAIEKPIDHHRLEYYIDRHGDFINDPKNKQDYVVKAIHENMSLADQFETLKYIEYYNETNGFTSFD